MTQQPRKRKKSSINMDGLTPFSAPDTSGGTVILPVKVPLELKEWFQSESDRTGKPVSQLAREALREYRDRIQSEGE